MRRVPSTSARVMQTFSMSWFLKRSTRSLNGDENFFITPSFYPALHKLLTLRRNWGTLSIPFDQKEYTDLLVYLITLIILIEMSKDLLAPIVLGYIYHGLRQVASHPKHPVGWFTEVFPALYAQRPDSECPVDYPTLMCYAGMSAKRYTVAQARIILETGNPSLFVKANFWSSQRDILDMKLSDEDFKFLLSTRSFVLLIRIGSELLLEPHYPNRFARQFRFDQDVPVNMLSFAAVAALYRRDTVKEAFNTVEIVAKMEGLVDIQRLRLLSSQDSAYTSGIAHMEDNLKELSKTEIDYYKGGTEGLPPFQKKGKGVELAEVGVTKLLDLEKEKHQLNNFVDSIISFNKY
ncbi:LOW QUALITY PROTEIN: hypothetical protein Cgig2_004292 [Carnegiea gigantea]|uniref:Uncharacterized protein n=1 Tax=Carnegiea gigantea TaxID=171969 RepID=A0A9Q1GS10_9CARY|nr:LOW QUALITY PROTEIN: hypothetical protein Cgig2_004292 [Carnegiea gigantea]